MGRNGRAVEPEFEPGAVRITEDLDMSVADVERLGFRVCVHWSGAPAVSERDAYAISIRRRMIARQRDAERRRREDEQAAEFARRLPRGIPAIPGCTAVETMFAVDADERPKSVREQLLDAELAHGKGLNDVAADSAR
jgi:hypothetical protein